METDLIASLERFVDLDSSELELISSSFKPRQLKKGEFFLRAGTVCRNIAFIQKGLVRYFVYKNNDEESTFEFTKEGEFIGDYQSFNRNSSSAQNIQAIEDCDLLTIERSAIQHIFNSTQNGDRIGRLIVEHRFEVMVNQLLSVYMQNHEDRYKRFISLYSDLAQRIPQYLIASYVGVKPPSLSRIRRRFTEDGN